MALLFQLFFTFTCYRYSFSVSLKRFFSSRSNLLEEVTKVHGLFCLLTDKIDAQVLDAAPHLKGAFILNC
jgi:hypothetical protein